MSRPSRKCLHDGRWITALLAVVVMDQGCTAPLSAAFEPLPARYVLDKGTNEISGQVAVISSSGYNRTCEDSGVFLFPVTPYWTAWAHRTFGNGGQIYAPRVAIQNVSIDRNAWKFARHSDCDGNGRFRFEELADGRYYVFSTVFWLMRWQQNGYGFMREVDVHQGQKASIPLIKDDRGLSADGRALSSFGRERTGL